jgi:hypothetical protein
MKSVAFWLHQWKAKRRCRDWWSLCRGEFAHIRVVLVSVCQPHCLSLTNVTLFFHPRRISPLHGTLEIFDSEKVVRFPLDAACYSLPVAVDEESRGVSTASTRCVPIADFDRISPCGNSLSYSLECEAMLQPPTPWCWWLKKFLFFSISNHSLSFVLKQSQQTCVLTNHSFV